MLQATAQVCSPRKPFGEDEELTRFFQLPRRDGELWRSGIGMQVVGTASPDCIGLLKLSLTQPAELEYR